MVRFLKRWLPILARILSHEAAFALFLMLIVYTSYGLFLSKMGFYWDDWETVYLARNNTFSVYLNYFIFDRPQAIWTQMLLVPLLGMNPLKWQVFGLLMRWVNTLLMYHALRSLLPQQKSLLRWAAVLLAVYPGFQQQALSAIYSRYLMLASLYFLSLWLMALAYRSPRWRVPAALLSIFLGMLQAITLEYFASLELLRPIMLYFLVRQDTPERPGALHKTLRFWLPYAVIPIAFLVYRYGYLPSILSEEPHPLVWVEKLAQAPLKALFDITLVLIRNLIYVTFSVWTRQIQSLPLSTKDSIDLLAWFLGLAMGVSVIIFFGLTGRLKAVPHDSARSRELILIGMVAILGGLLPSLILGREPLVGKWSDRLTLPAMYGCALIMAGLIGYSLVNHRVQIIFTGILVALAVSGHIQTTRDFRYDWKDVSNYLWQVVWRAPAVEKGTVFVSPDLPFSSQARYSIGLAIDLIYGSGTDPANPEYWWEEAEYFDLASENPSYNFRLRNIGFDASFDKSVILVNGNNGSCVHILDDIYRGSSYMMNYVEIIQKIAPFASSARIHADQPGAALPTEIFGPEPAHTWCYYFQKADLARQQENWPVVIDLYQQAAQQGFQTKNGAEFLPLIEAYLQTGLWSQAADETLNASALTLYNNTPGLCLVWQSFPERAGKLSPTQQAGFLAQQQRVFDGLGCNSN